MKGPLFFVYVEPVTNRINTVLQQIYVCVGDFLSMPMPTCTMDYGYIVEFIYTFEVISRLSIRFNKAKMFLDLCLVCCFTALQHYQCHFGRG